MNQTDRFADWQSRGVITSEQRDLLGGLERGEPRSVFLELNILLYGGVLAFIGGLGWTVSTWSQQLGDIVVLAVLSAIFAGSLWFCFSRAQAWSPGEVPTQGLVFDYVLYLGSLVWSIELAYIEQRFHWMSGTWDVYLLATVALYLFLAYRFDNRFVLSLALSTLAGWFGVTVSRWPSYQGDQYRQTAVIYSLIVFGIGFALQRAGWKAHFFVTYLHVAANVLFWAMLSGVFEREGSMPWFVALLVVSAVSLTWGIQKREFPFVAYAVGYGYIGVSAVLVREIRDFTGLMAYFLFTGTATAVLLVVIARRYGRER